MTIEEFLRRENARISIADKWMYFDDDGDWVVLRHPYGKKHNKKLYRGQNENEALMELKND